VTKIGLFQELQEQMDEVDEASGFKGYWFSISDALIIAVCGMLCGLQNVSDVHEWSEAAPVRNFLSKEFG